MSLLPFCTSRHEPWDRYRFLSFSFGRIHLVLLIQNFWVSLDLSKNKEDSRNGIVRVKTPWRVPKWRETRKLLKHREVYMSAFLTKFCNCWLYSQVKSVGSKYNYQKEKIRCMVLDIIFSFLDWRLLLHKLDVFLLSKTIQLHPCWHQSASCKRTCTFGNTITFSLE